MSYKKIEDIQYLYESINDQNEEVEECLDLIENQLRSEGYSDTAIHSFMETADEFALQEKVMLLDEGIRKKALELLTKYGPRLQNLGRRIRTGVKRNTPVKVRKTVKSTVQNAQDTTNKITTKGKEVLEKGKEVVKNNPKTSAVVGVSGLTAGAIATSGDGKKDNNDETPGTSSSTTSGTTSSTTSGTTKDDESAARKARIKEIEDKLTKKENDRNEKLNKELEVKPKEKEVKPETPVEKPKITARSLMRQRNIDRFGADKVKALMDKQKDFKTMQAKSMMPGAKPGAAKAEFAAKHPTSNVAKDLKKSKRVTQVMDLESYDAFDIVLGYLSESGQVDSMDEALYIMMEMDAATIQGIVRDFEMLTEEEADRVKDERLEKYGIGHDGSDKKGGSGRRSGKKPKGKTVLQKETEKKHGKGKTPLEVAKEKIESKYGKGAIAPSKKKK